MSHIIILAEIEAQQGENTVGTGVLETLRERVNAAHAFVETADKESPFVAPIEAKMVQIEDAVTNGYTSVSLSSLSDELEALMP